MTPAEEKDAIRDGSYRAKKGNPVRALLEYHEAEVRRLKTILGDEQ